MAGRRTSSSTVADRALYLAKPPSRSRSTGDDPTRDPYLAALDETTLRAARAARARASCSRDRRPGRRPPRREARLPLPARGRRRRRRRHDARRAASGPGCSSTRRLPAARTGAASAGRWSGPASRPSSTTTTRVRAPGAGPPGRRRSARWWASRSRRPARCSGVIGLASGDVSRPFGEREIEALVRFAQLASIALDNARLFERAQTEVRERTHAALHDLLTGLPNRDAPADPTRGAAARTDRRPHRAGRRGRADDAADRAHPARPRPVQGRQREPRPRGRRPAPRRGRPAPRRRCPAHRHGRPLRWRRVRDPPGPGAQRRARRERVAERIEAAIADAVRPRRPRGSSARARASPSGGRASVTTRATCSARPRSRSIRAKVDPVRSYVLFDPEMPAQTLDRIDLENDLRRAIERDELRAPLPAARRPRDRPDRRASRRSSAGSTRSAASSRRCRSSRSPRRPG